MSKHRLWTAAAVLLAAGALVYTYAGASARESERNTWIPSGSVPLTLDGMAFMKVAYPGEYAAITWLNEHVSGTPVIAEADDAYYDWRSRVSMFTGLPTIINGIHEGEQRYDDEMNPQDLCLQARDQTACTAKFHSRSDDLATLYNASDPAQKWAVIHRYGVRYIYVGFVERQCFPDPTVHQCYSSAGLAAFDDMVGHGLKVAYRHEGVTIYEVS
jgi:uncharacterized membrane protein